MDALAVLRAFAQRVQALVQALVVAAQRLVLARQVADHLVLLQALDLDDGVLAL